MSHERADFGLSVRKTNHSLTTPEIEEWRRGWFSPTIRLPSYPRLFTLNNADATQARFKVILTAPRAVGINRARLIHMKINRVSRKIGAVCHGTLRQRISIPALECEKRNPEICK